MMMEKTVRLVFRGELLPGVRQEDAIEPLARLLKLPPERAAQLFGGRRVVLKQGLAPEQAQPYVNALNKIGLQVQIEDVDPAPAAGDDGSPFAALIAPTLLPAEDAAPPVESAPRAPTPAASDLALDDGPSEPPAAQPFWATPDTPPADAPAADDDAFLKTVRLDKRESVRIDKSEPGLAADAAVEEIECPKCGHRQPKRTLCMSCGVDMPRYQAAQEEAKREEFNPFGASAGVREHAGGESAYTETPPIFSMSFDGRIGRLRYILYGAAAGLLAIPLVFLAGAALVINKFLGLAIIALIVIGILFFVLRAAALRLHDLGLTGWLSLILLLPVIGLLLRSETAVDALGVIQGLFSILLALWPGKGEENEYGPPPGPNHPLALPMALVVVAIGVASAVYSHKMEQRFKGGGLGIPGMTQSKAESDDGMRPASERSENRLVMYTTTSCPYCAEAREWLAQNSIDYVECNTDVDDRCNDEMSELDVDGVPTFVLRGKVMTGFEAKRLRRFIDDPQST